LLSFAEIKFPDNPLAFLFCSIRCWHFETSTCLAAFFSDVFDFAMDLTGRKLWMI
jgi:hypothetical protein